MSETKTPSLLPERDYGAIEAAVMETERGRWFLTEYARRNRSADTEMLLSAIGKLESALIQKKAEPVALNAPDAAQAEADEDAESANEQLRFDLMEMAATIAQTKLDIAAVSPQSGEDGHITTVTSELDSIVTATEVATYEILQGAEGVQEVAWTMRQAGVDPEVCDQIEAHVTEIFAACEFQDLTGQRIVKVVQVLEYIEDRLNSMINVWGDEELIAKSTMSSDLSIAESPLQPNVAISQNSVDELMWTEAEDLPDQTAAIHLGPVDMGDSDDGADAAESAEMVVEEPVVEEPVVEVPVVEEAAVEDEMVADGAETAVETIATEADGEQSAAETVVSENDPTKRAMMALSQDVRTILFS